MLNYIQLNSGRYTAVDLGAFGDCGFGGDQFLPAANSSHWDALKSNFPYSPMNLTVRPGSEGPQAVLTWDPPSKPIHRLMIRRKLKEYPRDPSDGILVLDDSTTASTRSSYVDNIVERVMNLLVEFVDEHMNETLERANILQHKSLFDILDTGNDGSLGGANQTTDTIFSALFLKVEAAYDISISDEDRKNIVTFFDLYTYLEPYDLLSSNTPGDCQWWYYRIFVRPNSAEIEHQSGGLGKQTISIPAGAQDWTIGTTSIDVQECDTLTVMLHVTRGNLSGVKLYTSPIPMPAGADLRRTPAAFVGDILPGAGLNEGLTHLSLHPDVSWKYVHVRATSVGALEADVDVYFIVNRNTYWQSNVYLAKPCLLYKTGRHLDIMWNQGHLPAFLRTMDDNSGGEDLRTLDMVATSLGRVNLWERRVPKGPLYRFLKLLSLELDRDHAYFEAMKKYDVDLFNAPVGLLQHIAFELGWQVDTDVDLLDVRAELARVGGFYKSKGRPHLVQGVSGQELGVTPRVQEGPGLVLRAADPTLFGKI